MSYINGQNIVQLMKKLLTNLSLRISQAFFTAQPLTSDEYDAAVGLVLGTVVVDVSAV